MDQNEIGHEWIEMPDLYEFIERHVSYSTFETLLGPRFMKENPVYEVNKSNQLSQTFSQDQTIALQNLKANQKY